MFRIPNTSERSGTLHATYVTHEWETLQPGEQMSKGQLSQIARVTGLIQIFTAGVVRRIYEGDNTKE